jgi:pimeloyl-ACP methyl ester carboxylesterase
MAQDIHALVQSLGYHHIRLVGHDIGLMVAYAYGAQYPAEVDRLVLMEAFLRGIGDWQKVWLSRDLWHFHFHGKTPLALVTGRERIYLEHFWNDLLRTQQSPCPKPTASITRTNMPAPGT